MLMHKVCGKCCPVMKPHGCKTLVRSMTGPWYSSHCPVDFCREAWERPMSEQRKNTRSPVKRESCNWVLFDERKLAQIRVQLRNYRAALGKLFCLTIILAVVRKAVARITGCQFTLAAKKGQVFFWEWNTSGCRKQHDMPCFWCNLLLPRQFAGKVFGVLCGHMAAGYQAAWPQYIHKIWAKRLMYGATSWARGQTDRSGQFWLHVAGSLGAKLGIERPTVPLWWCIGCHCYHQHYGGSGLAWLGGWGPLAKAQRGWPLMPLLAIPKIPKNVKK